MLSNNIINEILTKMSKIDQYFENTSTTTSQPSLIDTDFLTKTFTSNQPPISKRSNHSDRRKLFVGNLPAKTTLQELLDVFKAFGSINEQLSVVKDDNYAFIHFYEESDAERAFKAMNDSYFKNRYIRVQYSTSQGHMKKSKTFDTGNRLTESTSCFSFSKPTLQPSMSQYSSFASINEVSDTNKLINSNSIASFNFTNDSAAQLRPITGRSTTKLNDYFKADFEEHYQSMPYLTANSLLMPANCEQNRQNQLQMLQIQQQQQKLQQQRQYTETNTYDMFFGSNRFNDFSSFCSLSHNKENNPSKSVLQSKATVSNVFTNSTDTYMNRSNQQ